MLNQIITDIWEILSQYTVFNVLFSLAVIGGIFFLFQKKKSFSWERTVIWALFVVYLCFVVELTLLTRESGSRIGVSLKIWGTYAPYLEAKCWMVENLLLFIPLGILFPLVWKKMRNAGWFALVAFLLSLGIETTQLLTKRGYFQVDDIWLNVLGGLLGLLVYFLVCIFGIRSVLCGVVFLLLCSIIFGFSAQTGEESSGLSDALAHWLSNTLYHIFHWDIPMEKLTHPVRKTAHMTEYALLWLDTFGMLVSGYTYRKRHKPTRSIWPISVIPVLCVSISDEIHQLYVPGRAGQPIDVGWDMLGTALCILIVNMILTLWKKKNAVKGLNKRDA